MAWAGVLLCSTVVLLWPALWNGYPLFFYDSGDYIESSFTLTPAVWRTLPYGLFLAATHVQASLWLPIVAQALIVSWLLWELVLAFRLPRPVLSMVMIVLMVAGLTGLPWFAAQIMPDIFTGLMAIGLVLLAFAPTSGLRLTLVLVATVIAISAHASNTGTAIMIAITLALLSFAWRVERPRLLLPLAAVVLGALATPVAHKVFTGEFYVSRSAPIMSFARLLRSGEAQAYLREACPEAGYSLCPYVDELKTGWNAANDFLWDQSSPFYKIEGWKYWQRFAPEAKAITLGTLMSRPLENLADAVTTWGQQLHTFGTGSGLVPKLHEATLVQKRFFPWESDAYLAAREYSGFDLSGISRLHVSTIALFTIAGVLLALGGLGRRDAVEQLLLVVIVAAVVNAGVAAIFSNPDDRYQARLVWLFIPAVVIALRAPRFGLRR